MPQVCSIKKAKMSTPTEEETVQPKSDAPDEITEEVMSPEYKEIARDMFEKITEYLNGELAGAKATGCLGHDKCVCSYIICACFLRTATSEEYQLLHRLNQMTIAKYSDMTSLASRLNEVSERLNDKCKLVECTVCAVT